MLPGNMSLSCEEVFFVPSLYNFPLETYVHVLVGTYTTLWPHTLPKSLIPLAVRYLATNGLYKEVVIGVLNNNNVNNNNNNNNNKANDEDNEANNVYLNCNSKMAKYLLMFKVKPKAFFGPLNFEEYLKTNHLQLSSRISHTWLTKYTS